VKKGEKLKLIKFNGSEKGMTLLEILVAIAIFSFSIIPIIMMYRYTTQANLKSVNAIHAANLALQKMEEYKFGGVMTPANPGVEVKKWGEFERLYELMKEEANTGKDWSPLKPQWKAYERFEDYDSIKYFPNFKRYIRISFSVADGRILFNSSIFCAHFFSLISSDAILLSNAFVLES